ncbi:hypothetical protein FOZ62_014376, partial [Perkinsus olseni]
NNKDDGVLRRQGEYFSNADKVSVLTSLTRLLQRQYYDDNHNITITTGRRRKGSHWIQELLPVQDVLPLISNTLMSTISITPSTSPTAASKSNGKKYHTRLLAQLLSFLNTYIKVLGMSSSSLLSSLSSSSAVCDDIWSDSLLPGIITILQKDKYPEVQEAAIHVFTSILQCFGHHDDNSATEAATEAATEHAEHDHHHRLLAVLHDGMQSYMRHLNNGVTR